jgi:hypothetical protein
MLDPRKSPIADPVVTRLLLDVQLGRCVQQKAMYRDKQAFENDPRDDLPKSAC